MTDEALFAVLRSSQYREIRTGSQADRYRSAWQSARQRAQSWRELYLSARRIVDELTDSVPMAYYRDVVKKYRREIDQRDTRIRVLRGERDHLAHDADRLRESQARYRSAWLSARQGRKLWRKLYIEATTVAGSGRPVVDRALYEKHVTTVHQENIRARTRIEKLEDDLLRKNAELFDLRLAHSELQGSLGRRT